MLHKLILFTIFVLNERDKDMTTKRTYRTTANGTEWMIESDKWGCSLYLRANRNAEFHFSGEWFHNEDEADRYLDEVDRRITAPRPSYTDVVIPADYYGSTGRYYGD